MKSEIKQYAFNVATTCANMLDGMSISGGDDKRFDIVHHMCEKEGMGFLGMTQLLAEYAVYSEDKVIARAPQNFPGVYDYEVSYPFGKWFANQMISLSRFPSEAECRHFIDVAFDEFFAKGDEA